MRACAPVRSRRRQRGMSVIELMVAMTIGLVVVGAVLVSYLGAGQSGRFQAAYAQMNEDAQLAMQILSREIQLAGYSRPVGVDGSSKFTKTYSGIPVFGCDGGFTSPNATTSTVSCSLTGTLPAIQVVYEADVQNTVPSGGSPTDCLGASLSAKADVVSGVTYALAYNRYYLAQGPGGTNELYCASWLGNAGQPLVENIETMKLWYGVAATATDRRPVRYVAANQVSDWTRVVSVRFCLLMRSTEPVLSKEEEGTAIYLDCDSNTQTSNDRYLRRAYFSTNTLRNRMAF